MTNNFFVNCWQVPKSYIYKVLELFKNHIDTNLPFLKEAKLLLAISGGIDSVVLAHLCHQSKFHFALAHCNFNLRGDESDTDEEFVIDLAENLDTEIFVESFDCFQFAKSKGMSIQMAARDLRYNWFEELCDQLHFDYILTAHHADDDLETFLINLSRGTGLDGLIGIPEVNDLVVRPLLPFSRDQIRDYAQQHHIQWREDSSNDSSKYLRNKLRHEVIPKLKDINPQFLNNFLSTKANLNDAKTILEERLDEVFEKVIKKVEDDVVYLSVAELLKLSNPKAYLYYFLKDYGFSEWDDVVDLIKAQAGKQVFSQTHRLVKDREDIILTDKQPKAFSHLQIGITDTFLSLPFGNLIFEDAKRLKVSEASRIYVDKDLLKYPLTVRKWEEGEYFYPFGMSGRKKVSKFFKDEKLSLLEKEKTLLLCSGNQIVWIIGKRLDDRFKVTDHTKHILKISIQQ